MITCHQKLSITILITLYFFDYDYDYIIHILWLQSRLRVIKFILEILINIIIIIIS